MHIFKRGLVTGLLLQLAIGPVFFYIMNITIQGNIWDGLIGVSAVTIVDYLYIFLAIEGVGLLLAQRKLKKFLGIFGAVVLIIFGISMTWGGFKGPTLSPVSSFHLLSSFGSAFFLTLSNPLTLVFFTGVFATKAMEYRYTKKELFWFGFSTGLATLLFLGLAVVIFSFAKNSIPSMIISLLNMLVGGILIGYGIVRGKKSLCY